MASSPTSTRRADVVCVKLSTWPDALDLEKSGACLAAFAAIAESLA